MLTSCGTMNTLYCLLSLKVDTILKEWAEYVCVYSYNMQGFIQRRGHSGISQVQPKYPPSGMFDSAIYFVLLSPSQSDWFPSC